MDKYIIKMINVYDYCTIAYYKINTYVFVEKDVQRRNIFC